MTVVYLIRHSEKYKNVCNVSNSDSFQLCNEKIILSINGEKLANKLANMDEMSSIDALFASNYVRCIGTAKYIANRNNICINVIKELGERVYGVSSISEIVPLFEQRQWTDGDFKLSNGESRNEVTDRMYKTLVGILSDYRGKRVAIVSHGTAISFLLDKWCDISLNYNDDNKIDTKIIFNNKVIFNGNFPAPCVFKLVFDDNNNIISVENINIH